MSLSTAKDISPQGIEVRRATVALVGSPNSGKTTLFNSLTGLRYKVANYPGVTVEKKLGRLVPREDDAHAIDLLDLPGIYSFSGFSPDEQVTANVLLGLQESEARPDLIISVVDSLNLERSLYLTTQLIDLQIPIVVVLTMNDLALKSGISVKSELLSKALGNIPVFAVSARHGQGVSQLRTEIVRYVDRILRGEIQPPVALRWCKECDDFVHALGRIPLPRSNGSLIQQLMLLSGAAQPSSKTLQECIMKEQAVLESQGIDALSFEATRRYAWLDAILASARSVSGRGRPIADKIDAILSHRVFGLVAFLVVMAGMFQAVFSWASYPMELIDAGVAALSTIAAKLLPAGELNSLVVNGIIAGAGSVVIFLPQIGLLFFFISLLEDSGYLARAAHVTDRFMRACGLQGRSFIPLLSSFACAVPGIMSTRVIPSFADRLTTILVAPLMSCSARLPVYTLLIAACIPAAHIGGVVSIQGLSMLALYVLGMLGAAGVALILKAFFFRGRPAPFVMELPPLRIPSIRLALRDVVDRVILFVKSVSTVILACTIILWFLASHPRGAALPDSYAGMLGRALEPLFSPLGFNWELVIAILSSFAAREVFVSSLATVYNLESPQDASESLISILSAKHASGELPLAVVLSLLVFYVFACQCMSTLAVVKKETGGWKWPLIMFLYMTVLAYGASWLTYRVALMF